MAAYFLRKEENFIETIISLKLLKKLLPGDVMVGINIIKICSSCSCGVYKK